MAKITDVHRHYAEMLEKWERCREFIEGADALRTHDLACDGAAGRAYIPKLSPKQTREEYQAYIRRALYYNAVGRTLSGFVGLIMGSGASVDLPGQAEPLMSDADLSGTPLEEMIADAVEEVIEVNRFGWLVDRPAVTDKPTKLDAERSGLRPYIVGYKAEDIVNWTVERVGNAMKLTRVVLKEGYVRPDGKDGTRYRELTTRDDRVYKINVWEKKENEGEYLITSTAFPRMSGETMRDIPFYFFDLFGGKPDPRKPILLDLVEVNRSHYQSSADLEHARFTCSLPTPYFIGFSADETKGITLGGLNGIISTNPQANVGFLEYTGQGTEPLERALAQKEAMMAKLGARMLADEKRDAEAAETMRIRTSGENATLSDVAHTVARIAGEALTFAAKWFGASGEAAVELNTEYTVASASPQEITALLGAVQAGELPSSAFVARLRKVGLIEKDMTDEDIEAELEAARERRAESQGQGLLAAAAALRARGTAE